MHKIKIFLVSYISMVIFIKAKKRIYMYISKDFVLSKLDLFMKYNFCLPLKKKKNLFTLKNLANVETAPQYIYLTIIFT